MAKKLPMVAIVGQTNVGKSSLFNRIYGSQEAVVAREAGTTRDSVIRRINLSQTDHRAPKDKSTDPAQAFWLVDTAGLKKAEDEFEASIQDQITDATENADMILVVVDGTKYPNHHDQLIAKQALKSKKPVILLINKTDLKGSLPIDEFRRLGISSIIRTSAEHNIGIDQLISQIAKQLPPVTQPDDTGDELKIALIGRPNVGKSHLFNTLAGKQQAIVANLAGTTRDVNRVEVTYKKRPIELLDTAGIRRSGKQEVGIEKFSVLRTMQAIEEADICLLLMDVDEHSTQLDQKLAGIIKDAGKGLVLVISKWDKVASDDKRTDHLSKVIAYNFAFVPWAPLIFTSAITGQNVTKIFEIAQQIDARRHQEIKTRQLNDILQQCINKHPPAGLKNSYPKLRYMVQTDVAPPWFVVFGSDLKLLHWSYKRYLERQLRERYDFAGTPINFSFRSEPKNNRSVKKSTSKDS